LQRQDHLKPNGGIPRVMMNAELTNQNQTKIIIPIVYREDHICALRHLVITLVFPGTGLLFLKQDRKQVNYH